MTVCAKQTGGTQQVGAEAVAYSASGASKNVGAVVLTGPDRSPLGQLRDALDELVDAGVLDRRRRDGIEYPIWSAVHGLAVLAGPGPLRDVPGTARRHLEELTLTFIDEGLA